MCILKIRMVIILSTPINTFIYFTFLLKCLLFSDTSVRSTDKKKYILCPESLLSALCMSLLYPPPPKENLQCKQKGMSSSRHAPSHSTSVPTPPLFSSSSALSLWHLWYSSPSTWGSPLHYPVYYHL